MFISIKKQVLIQSILLLLSFVFLYQKAILNLLYDWSTDPNFSHGFLIPFVSLYMVWYLQNSIKEVPITPSKMGLWIIIFSMLVHILGNVGSELFLMRFSIIITLTGIIIYYWGTAMFRVLLVPVCYLIMMIPIPDILWYKLAFPLQLIAASISSETISMIGIPVFREGNILHLSNTSLEVVDACSGIRSLTSLLALTSAFSYLAALNIWKKWVLFLSAIPIAVAVNVIRLTVTGGLAAWVGPETAHGFLHDMSGLIIFGTALLLVYLVFIILKKIEAVHHSDN